MQDDLRTTDGVIALRNLHAQVEVLDHIAAHGVLDARGWGDLIDLVAVRGQILACAEDAERALALAEQRAAAAPDDGWGWLTLARMHDTFHQFADALVDLERAERLGVPSAALIAERALALHHLGQSSEGLRLAQAEAVIRPGFSSFATLAVLHAERGEPADAGPYFDRSHSHYRSVSPFPIAHLDLQRGKMWLRQGDVPQAQHWFEAVLQRVPSYRSAWEYLANIRDSARS